MHKLFEEVKKKKPKDQIISAATPEVFFYLSLYTARPSCEYYQQVYFVHSGLQDESLQVTMSKLP